jgi:Susd and RagB outer membrane lipoprotein
MDCIDAWISWRRLDNPQLLPATDALTDIPLRFPYPVNEQNVNRINYEAASTAIGGDDVATKLWWDKF